MCFVCQNLPFVKHLPETIFQDYLRLCLVPLKEQEFLSARGFREWKSSSDQQVGIHAQ